MGSSPNRDETALIAAHSLRYSSRWSSTRRTALARVVVLARHEPQPSNEGGHIKPGMIHRPAPPAPWTGSGHAKPAPWSHSHRPAPQSGCSPPHPQATARSAPAPPQTPTPSRHESHRSSSSRSPGRRTKAGAGRFAMPHDFRPQPPRNLRHAALGAGQRHRPRPASRTSRKLTALPRQHLRGEPCPVRRPSHASVTSGTVTWCGCSGWTVSRGRSSLGDPRAGDDCRRHYRRVRLKERVGFRPGASDPVCAVPDACPRHRRAVGARHHP